MQFMCALYVCVCVCVSEAQSSQPDTQARNYKRLAVHKLPAKIVACNMLQNTARAHARSAASPRSQPTIVRLHCSPMLQDLCVSMLLWGHTFSLQGPEKWAAAAVAHRAGVRSPPANLTSINPATPSWALRFSPV